MEENLRRNIEPGLDKKINGPFSESESLKIGLFLSYKGFTEENKEEVRRLFKEDFPKIFPNKNYVPMPW